MQATAVSHRTTAVSDLVREAAAAAAEEDSNATTTTTALARLQYALQKVRDGTVQLQSSVKKSCQVLGMAG